MKCAKLNNLKCLIDRNNKFNLLCECGLFFNPNVVLNVLSVLIRKLSQTYYNYLLKCSEINCPSHTNTMRLKTEKYTLFK